MFYLRPASSPALANDDMIRGVVTRTKPLRLRVKTARTERSVQTPAKARLEAWRKICRIHNRLTTVISALRASSCASSSRVSRLSAAHLRSRKAGPHCSNEGGESHPRPGQHT